MTRWLNFVGLLLCMVWGCSLFIAATKLWHISPSVSTASFIAAPMIVVLWVKEWIKK